MKKLGCIWTIGTILGTFTAQAQNIAYGAASEEDIAVFGTACENIKPDEVRSSVRVRATDKASFMAVSNLAKLSNVKKDFSEHDFNVLVYKLVDNYIEDMTVKTTQQDDFHLCVEVTGYLSEENLYTEIKQAVDEQNETERTKEDTIVSSDAAMIIQPTVVKRIEKNPQPSINKAPQEKVEIIKGETPDRARVDTPAPLDSEDKKGLVYIAPTEFYNNTKSSKYAGILKKQFAKNDYFYITANPDLADYKVISKVLRAKVDPLNSNTNRLQMVVSLELLDTDSNSSSTEHQNRFVLFSSEESEQEVAGKLMKKLFEQAGEQTINKIEQSERKKNRGPAIPKIITPATSD